MTLLLKEKFVTEFISMLAPILTVGDTMFVPSVGWTVALSLASMDLYSVRCPERKDDFRGARVSASDGGTWFIYVLRLGGVDGPIPSSHNMFILNAGGCAVPLNASACRAAARAPARGESREDQRREMPVCGALAGKC